MHQQAEESTARHEISDTLKCCKTRFASGDALIMLGRRPGVRGNRRGRRLERTRAGQSAPGEWQSGLKRHLESARAGQEAPREWPSAPKRRPESARAGQRAPGERPSRPGKRPCGPERAWRMAKRAKAAPGKRPCGLESAWRMARRATTAPGKRPYGPDSARRAPKQARKAPVRAGQRPGRGRLHQQAEESTARHEISSTLKCCKTKFASGDAPIMPGRRPGVRGNRRGRRPESARAGRSATR